ncbi:MAG TPA: SPOR domain-containing protein [Paracoccaceae bacterium]|nr:SPOR domain-containing protein [Paracoccaceae bacterium]
MRIVIRSLIGLVLLAGPGVAEAGPAEEPGADYVGRSYIDSEGCAFQRAVLSGTVLWVARIGADGVPVCGLEPTVPSPAEAVAEAPVAAAEPAGKAAARTTGRAQEAAVLTGRWIQVGAFADPANAERALARLAELDLPRATLSVKGGRLKAVLAGPFEEPEAFAQAVALLREAGFGDLFGRP